MTKLPNCASRPRPHKRQPRPWRRRASPKKSAAKSLRKSARVKRRKTPSGRRRQEAENGGVAIVSRTTPTVAGKAHEGIVVEDEEVVADLGLGPQSRLGLVDLLFIWHQENKCI